jgi:hypothetical protein
MSVRNILITDEADPDFGKISPSFIETQNHPPIAKTVQSYLYRTTFTFPADFDSSPEGTQTQYDQLIPAGDVIPFQLSTAFNAQFITSNFSIKIELSVSFPAPVPATLPEYIRAICYINNKPAIGSQYEMNTNPVLNPPSVLLKYSGASPQPNQELYRGQLDYMDYYQYSNITPYQNLLMYFGIQTPTYNPDGTAFVGVITVKSGVDSAINMLSSFRLSI